MLVEKSTRKMDSREMKDMTSVNMTQTDELHPILRAAKRGDAKELDRLLQEDSNGKPATSLSDLKHRFSDLRRFDKERKTPLHLAASIGSIKY